VLFRYTGSKLKINYFITLEFLNQAQKHVDGVNVLKSEKTKQRKT